MITLYAALAILLPPQATASIIKFEDVIPQAVVDATFGATYADISVTSNGFVFTGNPALGSEGLYLCPPGINQHNTSLALINANDRSIITFARQNGQPFGLISFYAGGRTRDFLPDLSVRSPYSVCTRIAIVGTLAAGGTVSTTVAVDGVAPYDWVKHIMPTSFVGLSSVTLTAQSVTGTSPEFLIDDIEVV